MTISSVHAKATVVAVQAAQDAIQRGIPFLQALNLEWHAFSEDGDRESSEAAELLKKLDIGFDPK